MILLRLLWLRAWLLWLGSMDDGWRVGLLYRLWALCDLLESCVNICDHVLRCCILFLLKLDEFCKELSLTFESLLYCK